MCGIVLHQRHEGVFGMNALYEEICLCQRAWSYFGQNKRAEKLLISMHAFLLTSRYFSALYSCSTIHRFLFPTQTEVVLFRAEDFAQFFHVKISFLFTMHSKIVMSNIPEYILYQLLRIAKWEWTFC